MRNQFNPSRTPRDDGNLQTSDDENFNKHREPIRTHKHLMTIRNVQTPGYMISYNHQETMKILKTPGGYRNSCVHQKTMKIY